MWSLRFELLSLDPSDEIIVVDIDARSLQEVGVWPWPRRKYAGLVDKLAVSGAEQIAFDIDFSSASTAEDDTAFANAMDKLGGSVSLAMFRQKAAQIGAGESGWIVNQPIQQFMDVSWPVIVSVPIEADGKVWRGLWGDFINGTAELSLPALLGDASGVPGETFWIDYGIDPKKLQIVSFVDVIDGLVPAETFMGKKVVVGASAQELRDLFSVPVHGILPGSIVQVLAAESIIQGRTLSKVGEVHLLALVLILIFPLALLLHVNWKYRLGLLLVMAVALEAGALFVQARYPLALDTGAAHAALVLAAAVLLLKQIGFHQFLLRIARAQTSNTRRMLDQVFDDSFDAIVVLKEDGRVFAVSKAALGLFSSRLIPGELAVEHLPADIIKDALLVLDADAQSAAPPEIKTVICGTEPDTGRIIEYTVTKSLITDVSEKGMSSRSVIPLACVTCRDVTDQRRAAEKIEYLASFDPITGLQNRNRFVEDAGEKLRPSHIQTQLRILAVFSIIDIDKITASLGFAYADKLRQAVAAELKKFLQEQDLGAIIGEDRFACLAQVPNTASAPLAFVERLSDAVSREYFIEGNRIPVSVNIGYAITYAASTEAEALLRQAANALSHATADPDRRIVNFDADLDAGLNRRRKLEIELGSALERNEMRVVFQPQVDLKTGNLIGVEALARWQSAEFGAVSPVEFIQVAEESGLIVDIGEWVLEESLRQAMTWSCKPKVAVNVSAVQLTGSDVPGVVQQALKKTGFPADRLDLEVTESLFVEEGFDLLSQLEKLRALGCSLSLDDFGTGYSGLGYIPRFPFTKIKIDRSFVTNMTKDRAHRSIVKAVVDMATAFDMSVLAEGIETVEHEQHLIDLGCQMGQGYLYSRPFEGCEIDSFAHQIDVRKAS